jgi:hypothetical protein
VIHEVVGTNMDYNLMAKERYYHGERKLCFLVIWPQNLSTENTNINVFMLRNILLVVIYSPFINYL